MMERKIYKDEKSIIKSLGDVYIYAKRAHI